MYLWYKPMSKRVFKIMELKLEITTYNNFKTTIEIFFL